MLEQLKRRVCEQNLASVKQSLLDKHYFRKHGRNAYYMMAQ